MSETDWPEDDAEAQSPGPNLERQFETDANGIVLRKTQEGNILKQLIVSGQVMTAYGKGTDPAKQLNDEGKPNYIAQGEFGATYEGIDNRYNSGASSYTVQSGDTLAGIARSVWGDASLWWKLADVNGLAAQGPDSRLTEGQSLSIPGQVSGQHNTAQTHKPYDPTEVVGDTTPNMPAPPADEGGGCGILGKIIMIVVAVAVTAVTGGAGGAVSSFWGGLLGQGSAAAAVATGATAAAAGSVASQAVGVAIGAQSKFSWKNVALAAVSGGVSGGLGTVDFTGSGELGSLGNTVIRSALGNTISQGIGVATGLQKSFDWKSVAGAAVGAGVGWGVGQALGSNANTLAGAGIRSFAAGAATALVRGGKISITQVAVDAFGSALGDGLGDALRVGQGQSQENSPAFMGGGAGGGGSGGNGHYEADNGPDWGTGAVAGDTGRWTAEPAGQPALTGGDFARMDRASEEVWAAQGGAWEQQPGTTATDRAFLEAFQNPMAPVGEGVLMAAGPGYSGMGSDRLRLGTDDLDSQIAGAKAFLDGMNKQGMGAASSAAASGKAAWLASEAQAASAQYEQGYGNVRDTSPAAGLLVNPETGLADFKYTSSVANAVNEGLDNAFGGTEMQTPTQTPAMATLQGLAYGAGRAALELFAPVGDFLQIGNELGRSVVTGEAPREINFISGIGQMAAQGATTADIINGGVVSLLTTPDRIGDAYERGDYRLMGEEFGALGLNAALAGAGLRGSMPNFKMGAQLAAEDFGASGVGQRFGAAIEGYKYQTGSLSYASEPGLKVPSSWQMGANKANVVQPGEFSVVDWTGYPADVPQPVGPFRLVEGAEYNAARDAANSANRTLRKDWNLVGEPVDIHEIQPVKFGGSPIDTANKIILDRSLHRQQVTPWWNSLQKTLEGK
ncbi:LysM peptidoglycan-binding domain-containing protein [Acidovorax facilis]|uniref:LysM peptidoglycan-binding domain-containing protein n=1 Tax=Acidovorax facilis TaxID=12917 RepID=UPI003CF9A689